MELLLSLLVMLLWLLVLLLQLMPWLLHLRLNLSFKKRLASKGNNNTVTTLRQHLPWLLLLRLSILKMPPSMLPQILYETEAFVASIALELSLFITAYAQNVRRMRRFRLVQGLGDDVFEH